MKGPLGYGSELVKMFAATHEPPSVIYDTRTYHGGILISLSNQSVLVAVVLALLLADANGQELNKDGAALAEIRVFNGPGRLIPKAFLGLSHEWGSIRDMMGSTKTGTNLVYHQMLRNLTAYGSDPIEIRIGGNSTDTNGVPSGDRVTPLSELWIVAHTPFTLGVNLGSGDVALSEKQLTFYASQLPKGAIEAIELGNEPDAYPKRKMRQEPYAVSEYLTDFDKWKAALAPLLPEGTRLVGPSWSSPTLPYTNKFLFREARSIGAFTVHFYAGNPYSSPAADYLLKPRSATYGPLVLAPAIVAAHNQQIPIRINELNSFYGVGVHGLSDAFSAALWSIDTMFEYVNAGVDGVNWEADGVNFCSPFLFEHTRSGEINTYTLKSATPLYYGLLFFQATTPKGAKLVPVELDTLANVKAWATVDSAGVTRMAILNKDETATGDVSVQLPGFHRATVMRLLAPSYSSLTGVTFGGRTLDGSSDGRLLGEEKADTVISVGDRFNISMPITSAALITFYR